MDFNHTEIRPDNSQEEVVPVSSQEGAGTVGSKEGAGRVGSQEGTGTVGSKEGTGTVGSEEGAGIDTSFEKEDDESLFHGVHETLKLEAGNGQDKQIEELYNTCEKNPGHPDFVSVNDFNINHLPKGQQDEDIVDFIKATADLTVRVDTETVSPHRPQFWPNTKIPFPLYATTGSDDMGLGTGMVCQVKTIEDINYENEGPCKCLRCLNSDTPSEVWGEVCIFTANHTVFDDIEARKTTCRLFFDSKESRYETLAGWTMKIGDIETDKSLLSCVTCDVNLLDKLVKMRERWRDSFLKKISKDERLGFDKRLMFIVSHPNGWTKKVTIGRWIDRDVVDGSRTKFTYTTGTCPGSSGAYVHPLMYDLFAGTYHHVHSGVNNKGHNFSGFGYK